MSKRAHWPLLRLALLADALASSAMGILLAAGADLLAEWLGLPPALLRPVGFALLPYGALLAWLARREPTPRWPAQLIVAGNVLWVAGSVLLLVTGVVTPTALGIAFVIVQALIVAILAEAQFIGLRRRPFAV